MSKKEHTDHKQNEQHKQQEQSKQGKKESTAKSKSKRSKKGDCTEELAEAQSKYDELNDKYLRLYSDFDNFRKRKAREFSEITKTAGKELIVDLLPVLDDFERALESMKEHQADEETRKGVELIYNKLLNLLKQKGLTPMDSLGKDFDTDWHEAITNIPAPSEDLKGKVVDVIQKGYLLNDSIIRYAKVVVGS